MRYDFDSDETRKKRKKIIKEIIIWVVEIVAVILLAYFLVKYAVEKTTVVGEAMETTLQEGDKIIINKLAYRFSKPKRFDVIVFKQSGKEHSYYNIKRIIGLPGETVQIKDGIVYINDEPIKEKAAVEAIKNPGLATDPITLEDKEYFVLGDNRNLSEDSRFANIGNVVFDDIIGKAWIRLKPFNFVNELNPAKKTQEESTE
ncbi:signal peptidase I [Anaerosporobacter faecicola]|uniref:signal peptidase I n=1 Tax=Anaerosporobacter faecicola TaxID=2718714 RepID=UPI00143C6968|nr:signal peptidase I [Anaerosporobacter faecicola]